MNGLVEVVLSNTTCTLLMAFGETGKLYLYTRFYGYSIIFQTVYNYYESASNRSQKCSLIFVYSIIQYLCDRIICMRLLRLFLSESVSGNLSKW